MVTPELNPAESAVLGHIRLFRITTFPLARSHCRDLSPEVIKHALRALRSHGLCRMSQLFPDLAYYALSREGALAIGANPREAHPIGTRGLAESYGILSFCAASETRLKLSRSDFHALFPELVIHGIPQGNYYRTTGQERRCLGYIHVDRGASQERIADRIAERVIKRRLQEHEWREFFGQGLFELAFVSASQEKATFVAGRLHQNFPKLELQVYILPDLWRIINRL